MAIDRTRIFICAAAVLVLGVIAVANIHLVSVSLASQPACVAHQTAAQEEGAPLHRAAKASC
tara:strand:- start:3338 stop:3523 length:186 start_codon:yes stop_codon:yes gene_type:complete